MEGEYPAYGNDDDRVDAIAVKQTELFFEALKAIPTYRNAEHTLSVLTITSNVVYGKKTGSTPDGRRAGDPLSYGIFQNDRKARNGLIGQMNAISQFDTHGISSATVTNFNLDDSYVSNQEYFEKTVDMLETFFQNGGMQFQLNYYSADMLRDAKKNPDKYRNLRVRVTGYSDFFTRLSEPIQDSIIRRCEK